MREAPDTMDMIGVLLMTPQLSAAARRVGGLLIVTADNDGTCRLAMTTLADMLDLDIRSVRRALGEICGDGRLFHREVGGTGRGKRSTYRPDHKRFAEAQLALAQATVFRQARGCRK